MKQMHGRYIVDVMKIRPDLPISGMGVRRAHDSLKTDFIRKVRTLVEEAATEMRNHHRDSEELSRMFNEELLDEGGASMDRFTKWVNESPEMARYAQSADTKLKLIELQKRYEAQVAESKGTWDVDWQAMLKEQNDHMLKLYDSQAGEIPLLDTDEARLWTLSREAHKRMEANQAASDVYNTTVRDWLTKEVATVKQLRPDDNRVKVLSTDPKELGNFMSTMRQMESEGAERPVKYSRYVRLLGNLRSSLDQDDRYTRDTNTQVQVIDEAYELSMIDIIDAHQRAVTEILKTQEEVSKAWGL